MGRDGETDSFVLLWSETWNVSRSTGAEGRIFFRRGFSFFFFNVQDQKRMKHMGPHAGARVVCPLLGPDD